MADLIPSNSGDSTDGPDDRDPRVIGLDSDDADDLLGAISSSTARSVLASLHESPATPSDLATDVDTSLQNVQYHLGNLSEAGLIEVTDTRYSEKGREMNVYAPADRALVVVAGREDDTSGLKSALTRLIGGIGVLGIGGAVLNRLARTGSVFPFAATGGADGGESGGGAESADVGGGGAGGANESTASEPDVSFTGESGDVNATGGEQTTAADATTTSDGGGGFNIAEATTTESADATQTAAEEATKTVTEAATRTAAETATSTPLPTSTPTATAEPTAEPATTAVQQATDATMQLTNGTSGTADLLGSLSPGALFFLGGLTVLVAWVALGVLRD
ncbi:helix-turn-helix domain-containing protein [Haloferax sp. MBLA0076]|uniref:Helix-turn-helix domain-containing protein n=1 Tax=Haloferax litoreum TaxID=2666140 RepID=A0A6A8GE06_9EURY|nr:MULTISPECIES: winged helix-turn-helix domain-containing protein [Haloferax]KAB1192645.1 winged helix-turn-helix transcriptional regulator [Haloferax sp. CBA1148]MRX21119.1 helix-turn-helix domain-containing protein [Haloferax litoreum]